MYCQDVDMVNFFNGDGDYHAFVSASFLTCGLTRLEEQRQIERLSTLRSCTGPVLDKIAMMLDVDVGTAKGYLEQHLSAQDREVEEPGLSGPKRIPHVDTLFGRRQFHAGWDSDDRARQFLRPGGG